MDKRIIINRIISNTFYLSIDGKLYQLLPPTPNYIAMADLIYFNTLNDSKFKDLITREQASILLQARNKWTVKHEEQQQQFNKRLEDLKIALYKALYHTANQKKIRKQIVQIEKAIHKNLAAKYSLEHMTLENHAQITRDNFLTAMRIVDVEGKHAYTYENFYDQDNYLLQRFVNAVQNFFISQAQYREIARTDPFRSLWNIGKSDVFGIPAGMMSDAQKGLILYSRMYDNVYESMDRPTDAVIADDYMLDGWFLVQSRKAEQERKQKEVDNILGTKNVDKHNNSGELFVMVNSKEEASKISELNDGTTKAKVQQRIKTVQEKGRTEEQLLPDVQMDLRNQSRQQVLERAKGGR